jgi:putative membrane protein
MSDATSFLGIFLNETTEAVMRVTMRVFGILGAALFLMIAGCQQSGPNVQAARETTTDTGDRGKAVLNDADKTFLKKAEEANIKERNLGRVMLEKSQNKDVKDYAQMLVDDHSKNLRDVVDLMNQKGMAQPKDLPEVKNEALDKLNAMSGPELDREFVIMMMDDHQKDVSEFRNEANTAQDKDVKDYATNTVPVLEKHLQKAQELQGKTVSTSSAQ